LSNQLWLTLELTGAATVSAKVDLHEWNAELMRMTLFPTHAVQVAGLSWWESVVGEPPETRSLRPREGRLEESGRIDDGRCNLTLQCESQRIDWLFTPVIADDQGLIEFPSFAALQDAADFYRRLLLPWLTHAPTCQRLAFGCVLSHPVDGREAGYRWISRLLPAVTLDPEDSTDFSYSINRPRPTKGPIEGLIINRLSKWSVARLRSLSLQLPHGQEILPRPELHACRLELDINTTPEFQGTLSEENIKQVIGELIELKLEIPTAGDVP
jgi:hypothetical protein